MSGCMHGFYSTDGFAVGQVQSKALGKQWGCYRMYSQWADPSPGVITEAKGRLILWSVKPPAGGWHAVASGTEDARIVSIAHKLNSIGNQVVFIFHHEPHDEATDVKNKGGVGGTSAEYKAAWSHIHDIFLREGVLTHSGGNVLMGYCAVASNTGPNDKMYPGDGIIDLICHDSYNAIGTPNKTFKDCWSAVVTWAKAHNKPLVIGEFGSLKGSSFVGKLKGQTRDQWFKDAAAYMKVNPDVFKGFCYFHANKTHNWEFLNKDGSKQDDGKDGWIAAFVADPYFTGTAIKI